MSIHDIRAVDLDSIMKDVQPRKYEELRTLFNGIFKYAVASGILQNNPVALIKFKRAERQNRECLDEIIVMKNGKIVESGTYKELMNNNSTFKSLVELG